MNLKTCKIKFTLFAAVLIIIGSNNLLAQSIVKISDQVWMTKNLDVDKFRNGDPIPQAKTVAEWVKAGEAGKPAWCYYNNDPANGAKYGKLYNWFAVNDPRGLAPVGYHVPRSFELIELIDSLGGDSDAFEKIRSTSGWGDDDATNSSGWSAFPGGYRDSLGLFSDVGNDGTWWSATQYRYDKKEAYTLATFNSLGRVDDASMDNKKSGFSVRCLSDNLPPQSTVNKNLNDILPIRIYNQVWMAKNLDVDQFRNGDLIPQAKSSGAWEEAGNEGKPAWCYYNNDPVNAAKYGKLYNWYAVNDPRGLAPEGWHVPDESDYSALISSTGSEYFHGEILKSTTDWKDNLNGTNTSHWSGFPGGYRTNNGGFGNIGESGSWWLSSEDGDGMPASFRLYDANNAVIKTFGRKGSYGCKEQGFSVRCIKD
jgi:uncharacterized protein (TIGR02145 family)